ncbi:hypothetical protein [Pyrococcus sp. ST04]|uniref:hypothetical protein n=1 Tax=Pyrococcus sp. ST04 TaxID=1183377 RepID=UPI0002605A0E|nr:hypothetical protein [Pyrococcus sp. ST04]AFK21951.1 hypothetical protein Py04_0349 [Pyrococcus sp. ST04]
MGMLKALRYPTILVGLFLLFISLGIAFTAMKSELVEKTLSGQLTPGTHLVGDSDIVIIVDANLTLFSEDANVSVSWRGKYYSFELKNETRIFKGLTDFPIITTDGNVKYELTVVGYSYPYSWLSPVGFVVMIAGSALSLLGFASYLQGEMEKVKRKKRKNTGGGEDVQGATWRKGGL